MKKKYAILTTLVAAGLVAFTGIVVGNKSNKFFDLNAFDSGKQNGWRHYSSVSGDHCLTNGMKEYWTDCNGTTTISDPKVDAVDYASTRDDVDRIVSGFGEDDERIVKKGHNFVNGTCDKCGLKIEKENIFETFNNHATKGTQTVTKDGTMSSDGFGSMYVLKRTYNDYTSRFPLTNYFLDYSLEDIDYFQFRLTLPYHRFFVAGDNSDSSGTNSYEIYASANGDTPNEVSTIVVGTRIEGTDNWTISDTNHLFMKYGGGKIDSFTLSNRKTLNELFHNFTNWGTNMIYVGDFISDKHICVFDDTTGLCECGSRVITSLVADGLSVDAKYVAPAGMGKMYKKSGYGSNLFKSYSLNGLDKIKFYLVNEDSGNGFILRTVNSWTDYQGLISAGSNPQTVVATRNGTDWTVTTEAGIYLGAAGTLASTAGSSFTVSNPTNFNDLFKTLSASQSIYVSDIIDCGKNRVSITDEAIVKGSEGGKTYTLEKIDTKRFGFYNLYNYSCSGTFRALFASVDVSQYKQVEFYINMANSNDQITFATDDSYFGIHKGANVKLEVKATNLGGGTWKLSAVESTFRLSSGSLVTELTVTNRSKLNELFSVTANGWANTPFVISDIMVTK